MAQKINNVINNQNNEMKKGEIINSIGISSGIKRSNQ